MTIKNNLAHPGNQINYVSNQGIRQTEHRPSAIITTQVIEELTGLMKDMEVSGANL